MHLIIDHAGNQVSAVGIDHLGVLVRRDVVVDPLGALTDDEDVGIAYLSLVDQACITD